MSSVTRKKWFTPVLVLSILAVVFLVTAVFGPEQDQVEQRLEEEYGLASVAWTGNARFQPEVLVLDGQDVSDECTVKGEWGSLEDLRIECDTDVGIDGLG